MMKNSTQKHIIIAGVPRAGKTTLCSKIVHSLKYQHLAMDGIMCSFEEAFPETGVLHTDCWDFIETSKQFIKFMKRFSETGNYDKLEYRLAFDLYHITPKDYYENIDANCCDIYFLGYSNITQEEMFNQIRKFDVQYDWTKDINDEKLKYHISQYIEISKWLQDECNKYNLTFIDVSTNREKVLNDLALKILDNSG